jgi:hypothetical protein
MSDTCKRCGAALEFVKTPELPHYGKMVCVNSECGRCAYWVPKPDQDKARRPAAHRDLVKAFSRGYCELCLTREDQLRGGRVLEAHHVVEFTDGGSNERDNILIVCTGCHRLVHWLRTYNVTNQKAAS